MSVYFLSKHVAPPELKYFLQKTKNKGMFLITEFLEILFLSSLLHALLPGTKKLGEVYLMTFELYDPKHILKLP